MGKTNKCSLREDETLIEVIKNANVCMIKSSRFVPFSSLSLNTARTYQKLIQGMAWGVRAPPIFAIT